MTIVLFFAIAFTTLMTVIAMMMKTKNHRLLTVLANTNAQLKKSEKEKKSLKEEILHITKKGGICEATVLSIAGEIARIENNLYHMEKVPGRKQVMKALERMKGALQAEDYTIVPLLGCPYKDGMMATATFVLDDSLEMGASIIQSVQKPQVNYRGRMIQSATITVAQNL